MTGKISFEEIVEKGHRDYLKALISTLLAMEMHKTQLLKVYF